MNTRIAKRTMEAIEANESFSLFERLSDAKAQIAQSRTLGNHATASAMRDELLYQVEAYLDPQGEAYRTTLQTIQGRAAVALAEERVDGIPF